MPLADGSVRWRVGLALVALAAAAAAIVAGSMAVARFRQATDPWYAAVCDVDATLFGVPFDCDTVNSSAYADLGGIPLSVLGVAFYLALLLLAGLAFRGRQPSADKAIGLLFAGAMFAIGYAALLMVAQIFHIGAICPLCIILYTFHLLVLAGVLVALRFSLAAGVRAGLGVLRRAHREPVFVAPFALFVVLVASIQISTAAAGVAPDTRLAALRARLAEAVRVEQTLEGDDAAVGPASAEYLVVEFSDFMCPFCRQAAMEAHALERDLAGRVRLVFKHYPLDTACNPYIGRNLHPGACDAAAVAVCANQAGKFWLFHDAVFSAQKRVFTGNVRDNLAAIGEQIGLSSHALLACIDHPETRARVLTDIKAGHAIGVTGTPAFSVNGRALFTGPLQLGAGSVRVIRQVGEAGLLKD